MNEFTKDELEYLISCPLVNCRQNIINKLQSMIDNYAVMKVPTFENYCCSKCYEEWHNCECKDE